MTAFRSDRRPAAHAIASSRPAAPLAPSGLSLLSALFSTLVAMLLAAGVIRAAEPTRALDLGSALGVDLPLSQLSDLSDPAVALPQIVNLARLDPTLAASMIPDGWIDDGIENARLVAHEEPRRRPGALAAPTWPIGPWQSAGDVERSLHTLDPAAAASLYRALAPRIAARCKAKGASFARCEQELRMGLDRLTAGVVAERAAGRDAVAVTDTQLEFARMGTRVVDAGRAKLGAVARAIWP